MFTILFSYKCQNLPAQKEVKHYAGGAIKVLTDTTCAKTQTETAKLWNFKVLLRIEAIRLNLKAQILDVLSLFIIRLKVCLQTAADWTYSIPSSRTFEDEGSRWLHVQQVSHLHGWPEVLKGSLNPLKVTEGSWNSMVSADLAFPHFNCARNHFSLFHSKLPSVRPTAPPTPLHHRWGNGAAGGECACGRDAEREHVPYIPPTTSLELKKKRAQ